MATRDRSGRPIGYHHYGFGAAVLAEMALQGHLRLEGRHVVAAARPTDPLYATVWHDAQGRRKKASWWVARLSRGRYRLLRRQFTHRLVESGVLSEVPGMFGTRYPTHDATAEAALRQRITHAVQRRDANDARTVCLVAIAAAAGSTAEIHPDRHMRRQIRRTARQWIRSDAFAKAVGELVAAITAVVVATAATSS